MRYIDSGSREASQVLGEWFANEKADETISLKFQTGYFSIDGIMPLLPIIEHLNKNTFTVSAVIGSNDGETLQSDLNRLINALEMPRNNALAAVVNFSAGLFHPKVYHLSRLDGSQAAYVGSGNLTFPAVSSLNIEAGLILDTRDDDDENVLNSISKAIDAWTDGTREGATLIKNPEDISDAEKQGIISSKAKPRKTLSTSKTEKSDKASRPALRPIVSYGKFDKEPLGLGEKADEIPNDASIPVEQIKEYADYILFAPDKNDPTEGHEALTGTPLPENSAGLILTFNADSSRHFIGGSGTANISLPVATLSTLRFGFYEGKYRRPRAEFNIRCRYLYPDGQFITETKKTGIMAYGYAKGESGHRDIRMVLPGPIARSIKEYAEPNKLTVPAEHDVYLLEWPTAEEPEFKLTCFDTKHPLYGTVSDRLRDEIASEKGVGNSTCLLPDGLSPKW